MGALISFELTNSVLFLKIQYSVDKRGVYLGKRGIMHFGNFREMSVKIGKDRTL